MIFDGDFRAGGEIFAGIGHFAIGKRPKREVGIDTVDFDGDEGVRVIGKDEFLLGFGCREALGGLAVEAIFRAKVVMGVVGPVVPNRIFGEVASPGVDRLAGGIDSAVQDAAESHDAGIAGGAHPDDAADLRVVLELIALKHVAGVDKDNDFSEVGFDHLEHVFFVVGELEEVLVGRDGGPAFFRIGFVGSAVAGIVGDHVGAFGAFAGDHDERGIPIEIEALFESGVVEADFGFADGSIGVAVVAAVAVGAFRARTIVVVVEGSQSRVHFESRFGERFFEGALLFVVAVANAGAAAAADDVDGVLAEDRDSLGAQ